MSDKCWKCGAPRTKPRKPPDYKRKYRNKNFIQHDPEWFANKSHPELEAIFYYGGDEKTRHGALGEIGLRNMSTTELRSSRVAQEATDES